MLPVSLRRMSLWTLPRTTLGAEAIATFVGRIGWVGLEFLVSLLMARWLGLVGYGAYAVALSAAALLGAPAALGFDRLLLRELAVQRALGQWTRMRGLLRTGNFVSLGCSTLLAAGLWWAAPRLVGGGSTGSAAQSDAIAALRNAAFLLPLVAYARQRQSALQGLGRVALGQTPEMLLQPLVVLALFALNVALAAAPWTGRTATAMQLLAAATAGLAGALLLRRVLPHQARDARPDYALSTWLAAALPLLWVVLANMVLNHADTILVGALRGPGEAGAYRAASQVAALVALPMTAINLAAAPRLAALHATGDLAGMQRIALQAVRVSSAAGFMLAVTVCIAGHSVLNLFGPGFDQAWPALLLLTAGQLFNTMSGTSGYVLIMTRHSRLAAGLFTVAGATGIVAQAVLIPAWGVIGAAAGTLLALGTLSASMAFAARRRVGIRTGLWSS